ncbi:MAG: nucleotidyltransferase domain-containing protein [Cyanobacteriota bacterium]|jgi:predicted nucleotidyltransferase
MTQFGLAPATIAQIQQVFSAYPEIEQAILYGSRAKGNYRPGSDIDLTLVGDLSGTRFLALQTQLDDLLLPYTLDISLFSQLKYPPLLNHIQRVGIRFYSAQKPIAQAVVY